MKKITVLGLALVSVPFLASAVGSIGSILGNIVYYLNFIVPALVTIAVIYFIIGVVSFMTASEEEAKKKGRTKIINGLIGLFVIVAFWGIIAVVKNSFDIGNATGQSITPCVPTYENDCSGAGDANYNN
jgi:heme/copper-type cytochrome/quinol oxidase subunit 4